MSDALDLSTDYLGLKLRSPLVASPSPLTEQLDNVRRLEDAGAGAIVMHSLFEEQIQLESHDLDHHLSYGAESSSEAVSYFPDMTSYNLGPDGYVEHLRKAKQAVAVPVIGSLNGISTGGWIRYARLIEEAGADALELNIYFLPTDANMTGTEVEAMYCALVRDVAQSIKIPVAVKIGPFFSAPLRMALDLQRAGALGLVLFNRFYQPDIDLENLEVVPNLTLSTSEELRLRLRWTAILFGRTGLDLAVTGGVHNALDALKALMAGANVAMMTSAVLRYGIGQMTKVHDDLRDWMERHEYESIKQMRGSMSQLRVAHPAAFERANYLRVLRSFVLQEPRPRV